MALPGARVTGGFQWRVKGASASAAAPAAAPAASASPRKRAAEPKAKPAKSLSRKGDGGAAAAPAATRAKKAESASAKASRAPEPAARRAAAPRAPEPGHKAAAPRRALTRPLSVRASTQAKWRELPESRRTAIMAAMRAVLPTVLVPVRTDERRQLVHEHLSRLLQNIEQALATLRVPPAPAGRTTDPAKLAAQNHALEEKLLQDLNDVAQLQARVEAERALLEQEREYLKTYKENRAAAEAWHRDLHRTRLHPLLRTESGSGGTEAAADPFRQEEAHLQRALTAGPAASAYWADDDRKLREVLLSMAQRLGAIEAASLLPADTASLLGELRASASVFLDAVGPPTAVLDAVLPPEDVH